MKSQVVNLSAHLPTVVIVGRPNVGKSTLFNRIIRQRLAIEAQESGVTRDRVGAVATWDEKRFFVIDTGGLGLYAGEKAGSNTFDELIREQLLTALETADVIILVADVTAGVTPLDEEVARVVRETGKRVVVAPNKADNAGLADAGASFSELGFETVTPISCLHRRGLDELMEEVTAKMPAQMAEEAVAEPIHIAIVGRPNVGKSSIVNCLLGENRVIVSEIPGTTRDAVDVPIVIDLEGSRIAANLIDTAGLRRRGRVDDVVEYFSGDRTHKAIERADIVMICLDASSPVSSQDKRICRMVCDAGKACLLLANKWDEAGKSVKQKQLLEQLAADLPFMSFAPVLTCCALSGYNFGRILATVVDLYERLKIEIPTSLVNQVLRDIMVRVPAPAAGTASLKVYYGVYAGSQPPTFILFVNKVANCQENYRAYLQHQLQTAFGLEGLPVKVDVRPHHSDVQNRARYGQIRKGLEQKKPEERRSRKRRRKGRR